MLSAALCRLATVFGEGKGAYGLLKSLAERTILRTLVFTYIEVTLPVPDGNAITGSLRAGGGWIDHWTGTGVAASRCRGVREEGGVNGAVVVQVLLYTGVVDMHYVGAVYRVRDALEAGAF
jgi:hypothetical protein